VYWPYSYQNGGEECLSPLSRLQVYNDTKEKSENDLLPVVPAGNWKNRLFSTTRIDLIYLSALDLQGNARPHYLTIRAELYMPVNCIQRRAGNGITHFYGIQAVCAFYGILENSYIGNSTGIVIVGIIVIFRLKKAYELFGIFKSTQEIKDKIVDQVRPKTQIQNKHFNSCNTQMRRLTYFKTP